MGNVLEISFEAPLFQAEPFVHPLLLFAILALLSSCGLFAFYLYLRSLKSIPDTNPPIPLQNRTRNNPLLWTIALVLLLSIVLIPSSNGSPIPKNRARLAKKAGFAIGSSTAGILGTTAAYFGLESLMQYLSESPDLTVAFVAIFGCFLSLIIILILKATSLIYNHVHKPPITQTLQEILQRTDPPKPNVG
jgi:hypothetical protein